MVSCRPHSARATWTGGRRSGEFRHNPHSADRLHSGRRTDTNHEHRVASALKRLDGSAFPEQMAEPTATLWCVSRTGAKDRSARNGRKADLRLPAADRYVCAESSHAPRPAGCRADLPVSNALYCHPLSCSVPLPPRFTPSFRLWSMSGGSVSPIPERNR